MTTHSSNTAKSFQKLLQFAVSQGPSKTDVSATSTQVEAVADILLLNSKPMKQPHLLSVTRGALKEKARKRRTNVIRAVMGNT
jgi:hypothetical protein